MATQDLSEHTEPEPEPINMQIPLEHENHSKIATEGSGEYTEPEKQTGEHTEVDPKPLNMEIPFEPELTLQPWLQPEAKGSKQNPQSQDQKQVQDRNQQIQQPETQEDHDRCKTPDIAPASIEERCYMWAIMPRNDNKYETMFQLGGPNTQEAMRYNFMTMAPETEIDMTTVSVVCHILKRELLKRFQRDVYCVPPEILIRMFDTYGTSYINKKTKMPYLVSSLKDQQLMELLDKEEFYIADSVFGADTSDPERSKLHRFACNILNQLRVWAGAQSIIKIRSIALELRAVDVPKQPNPMDCGVYVMKWMEVLDSAALSSAYTFKTRCPIEEWDQDQLNEFKKEIVSKVLMSEHNTLNIEAISQATNMTQEAITEARRKMPRRLNLLLPLEVPFFNLQQLN
ncbi:hypothetical protein PIB30_069494 [Stylosanthes scabra]|uniref:Ubiquitin-like protease family profile domain-containing protein n=1 Tax=Stylosanthes scabra TaxID=79078 RepID=A0ABU6SNC6_9FABA|nr:hypothetical protein [Stylosanthes scabra]